MPTVANGFTAQDDPDTGATGATQVATPPPITAPYLTNTSGSSETDLSGGQWNMSSLPYSTNTGIATAGAQNAYAQGQAALKNQAPTITNLAGAQSRAQLAGVQGAYGTSNASLANIAGGGGVNAGQATMNQGLSQNVAAQMAAAHSGRGGQGGYNLGGAAAGQQAGLSANMLLASQAAQARGAQISQAQQGLGANYAAQGGIALAQGNLQQQAAVSQAQMQQKQQAMNIQQAQTMYGQSAQEQAQYLANVNAYLNQLQQAQQIGIAQQNQTNASTGQILGIVGGAASGTLQAGTKMMTAGVG